MTIICHNCGEKLDNEAVFCSECGNRIEQTAKATSSQLLAHGSQLTAENPAETCRISNVEQGKDSSRPVADSRIESRPSMSDKPETTNSAFKVSWNQGGSLFIAGVGSSLEFEISPQSDTSSNATNFRMLLKLPGETQFTEQKLQYISITKPVKVNVNYRPDESFIGVNQAIELHFTYTSGGQEHWLSAQLPVDIYPSNQTTDKVIENFNIRIDSIHQEGKAGDPNLSILDNLKLDKNVELNDLLKKLKDSNSLWATIELIRSHALAGYEQAAVGDDYPRTAKMTAPASSVQQEPSTEGSDKPAGGQSKSMSLTTIATITMAVAATLVMIIMIMKPNKAEQPIEIKNEINVSGSEYNSTVDNKVEQLLSGQVKNLDTALLETEGELEKAKQELLNLEKRRREQQQEAARDTAAGAGKNKTG